MSHKKTEQENRTDEIKRQLEKSNKEISDAKLMFSDYMAKNGFAMSHARPETVKRIKIYSKYGAERLPEYKTKGSSGMDLAAAIPSKIKLQPFERRIIPTGIYVDIPEGYEFQIRPRSGTSFKKGITLANCVGTIDCDYVDEIGVIVVNLSNEVAEIKPWERIAQMVLAKVEKCAWVAVDNPEDFNSMDRTGGFGSTGEK